MGDIREISRLSEKSIPSDVRTRVILKLVASVNRMTNVLT